MDILLITCILFVLIFSGLNRTELRDCEFEREGFLSSAPNPKFKFNSRVNAEEYVDVTITHFKEAVASSSYVPIITKLTLIKCLIVPPSTCSSNELQRFVNQCAGDTFLRNVNTKGCRTQHFSFQFLNVP